MKNINLVTKLVVFLILLLSIKFSGCEQEDLEFYIDCDSCLSESPLYGKLYVYVTINEENPYVPLVFYKGNYEANEVDWVDTAYEETFWLVSDIGREYSVKATYKRGDDVVVAIDGDKMTVVDGEGECYPPCYVIRGGTLDLTMKE